MILFLISLITTLVCALGYVTRRSWKTADLLVNLKNSLTYEAIALYNLSPELEFEFVPDKFAVIMMRERQPFIGEPHWNYWSHFKDTRKDWHEILKRVRDTGIVESRIGEVIIYPDGSEVLLDWECGPRYDSGRPWRRRKLIGVYITHRRSLGPRSKDIEFQLEAMRAQNEYLQKQIEQEKDKNEEQVAKEVVKRFFSRYQHYADDKELKNKLRDEPVV